MFSLVANLLLLVIAGAMLLGGAALVAIGVVLISRARSFSSRARYSQPVVDPASTADGTGLPHDFADRPVWARVDLGADEVGPPVDPAAAAAVQRSSQRRRGMLAAITGAVLLIAGIVLLLLTLEHVLSR